MRAVCMRGFAVCMCGHALREYACARVCEHCNEIPSQNVLHRATVVVTVKITTIIIIPENLEHLAFQQGPKLVTHGDHSY